MKRVIKSATMDDLAEAVANVSSVVENFFEDIEGMSSEEAKEYYHVDVDDFKYEHVDGKFKKITVSAEMNLEDFLLIEPALNKAVQSVDPDSYFEPVTSGTFEAVVALSKKEKKEDPIFNHKNIDSAVELVAKQVSKAIGEDFRVEECYIADPYYNVNEEEDENHVRIFVTIESESYESLAFVDFYKDDVVSAQQVRMDLMDELYTKLINSVVER